MNSPIFSVHIMKFFAQYAKMEYYLACHTEVSRCDASRYWKMLDFDIRANHNLYVNIYNKYLILIWICDVETTVIIIL